MTAAQIKANNPPRHIKLRGLKVKTPDAYKEWEIYLDCSTGEIYEKVICESGDTSREHEGNTKE